jgi:hypothetical protein
MPDPLVEAAIAACRASMAANPVGEPAPERAAAVVTALGPYGRVLDAEETAIVVAARPELRARLIAPVDARFVPPAIVVARRLENLLQLGAPESLVAQERTTLAALAAAPPFVADISLASDHPDPARFPGNPRRLHVALGCASLVAPWLGDHPAQQLLADAHRILDEHELGVPSLPELRNELERATFADDDMSSLSSLIVRTIVLVHDLATETDGRVEQSEPHDLVRFAIRQHDALGEADMNARFFPWWLDQAVPAALEAYP